MKKYLPLISIIIIASINACTKSGVADFAGNYSFKTSGYISAVRDSMYMFDTVYVTRFDPATSTIVIDTTVVEHSDTVNLSINTEAGQMDITPTGKSGTDAIITMNVTGGDMLVYQAHAQGDKLTIEPKKRFKNNELDVTVSGEGTRYDNIVLFSLNYSGFYSLAGIKYCIISSDIDCRAKLNEK